MLTQAAGVSVEVNIPKLTEGTHLEESVQCVQLWA